MLDSNFWNDSETANRLVGELKSIKNIVSNMEELSDSIRGNLDVVEMEEDVDIRYIQQLLGHSSINTTQIYTHVSLKKQRNILATKHPRNKITV